VTEASFAGFGLELTSFYLQSLSLPEEVQQHLDRASSMHIVGDLKQYTQFEAADSLSAAASNPSGVAGAGVGLGAGLAMAQGMTQAIGGALNTAHTADAGADPLATIERLAGLLQKGILTQAEFDEKKTELLKQIR
jgi:membrane protease subunit (stomatin/prohibitin family)